MAKFKVYLTVHFETEVEADTLEDAYVAAGDIDYGTMHAYDEDEWRIEPIDSNEV
jgi:hypothetical protein